TLPERTQALAAAAGLDGSVLGFTVLLCVVTAALFGVLPALLLARGDLSAVRGELRTTLGRRAGWLQSSLVILEVALALAPLLGAGLVLQSVNRMLKEDPGFRPEQAFAFRVFLPDSRYPDDASRRTFTEAMVNRLQALRGVRYAGAVNDLPLNGSHTNGNSPSRGGPGRWATSRPSSSAPPPRATSRRWASRSSRGVPSRPPTAPVRSWWRWSMPPR